MLDFSKGELPIMFLGVPLSTKGVSIVPFQPWTDKILGRVKSKTANFVSYVGRTQLIKSVLFSIQVFSAKILLLKKVFKIIKATCRSFLWTCGVELSKKLYWPGIEFVA